MRRYELPRERGSPMGTKPATAVTNSRTILGVALLMLLGGCDPLHAPIYNLTSCPIEVAFSITKFHHSLSAPAEILPGRNSGVLGGNEPIKYDEMVIQNVRRAERRYDEDALDALRPAGVREDQWAYSDSGLSFLRQEPSAASLKEIAAQPCEFRLKN